MVMAGIDSYFILQGPGTLTTQGLAVTEWTSSLINLLPLVIR